MVSVESFYFRAVKLNEIDVREALTEHVMSMEGCCIDKGPLKNGVITGIKPVMAVHVSFN